VRKVQWQQLELPWAAELTPTGRLSAPTGMPHTPVGAPVDSRCELCGWPVRVHSVRECDVDECPFVLNFLTSEVTVERK